MTINKIVRWLNELQQFTALQSGRVGCFVGFFYCSFISFFLIRNWFRRSLYGLEKSLKNRCLGCLCCRTFETYEENAGNILEFHDAWFAGSEAKPYTGLNNHQPPPVRNKYVGEMWLLLNIASHAQLPAT